MFLTLSRPWAGDVRVSATAILTQFFHSNSHEKLLKIFVCLFEKPTNYLTPQFRPPAQYSFHSLNLLYLVLVWMEQFSGQFSETSTGLNKFGQHSSLAQTRRQKSATWSDVRTILATARYVLPLYLEMRESDGENAQLLRPAWYGVFRK